MLLFCVASCLALSAGVVAASSELPSSGATPTSNGDGSPTSASASSDLTSAVVAASLNGGTTPVSTGISGNGNGSGSNGNGNGNGHGGLSANPALIEPLANTTVVNGSFAELSCVAHTDGRNVVIVWLQSDEFKVLFYGSSRVTEDKRLSVRLLVEDGKTESTLRISPVLDVDQGKYICRLPRKEKIYTESMYLSVVPAPADQDANASANATSTSLPPPPTPPSQLLAPQSSSPNAAETSTSTTISESSTLDSVARHDSSTTNPDRTVTSR